MYTLAPVRRTILAVLVIGLVAVGQAVPGNKPEDGWTIDQLHFSDHISVDVSFSDAQSRDADASPLCRSASDIKHLILSQRDASVVAACIRSLESRKRISPIESAHLQREAVLNFARPHDATTGVYVARIEYGASYDELSEYFASVKAREREYQDKLAILQRNVEANRRSAEEAAPKVKIIATEDGLILGVLSAEEPKTTQSVDSNNYFPLEHFVYRSYLEGKGSEGYKLRIHAENNAAAVPMKFRPAEKEEQKSLFLPDGKAIDKIEWDFYGAADPPDQNAKLVGTDVKFSATLSLPQGHDLHPDVPIKQVRLIPPPPLFERFKSLIDVLPIKEFLAFIGGLFTQPLSRRLKKWRRKRHRRRKIPTQRVETPDNGNATPPASKKSAAAGSQQNPD